ncbi:hypothetical protein [Sporisorium scitamineum]|uniref:Uncharacterized protein n=1 Tax=Sporisorium scitamineum TaxID=49012 RepID=A0A0F7S1J6_9BASI|nr:hypothetical protein [Sporisorium scitamineum]
MAPQSAAHHPPYPKSAQQVVGSVFPKRRSTTIDRVGVVANGAR